MHYFISAVAGPVVGPVVTVDSTTSTSIHISWTTICQEVEQYEVAWKRDTTRECPAVEIVSSTLVNSSTGFNITELEENSHYMLTVTANTNGLAINNSVIGITAEAGNRRLVWYE